MPSRRANFSTCARAVCWKWLAGARFPLILWDRANVASGVFGFQNLPLPSALAV